MNSSFRIFSNSSLRVLAITTTASTVGIGFATKLDRDVLNSSSPCACDSARDYSFSSDKHRQKEQNPIPNFQPANLRAKKPLPSILSRLMATIGILSLPRLLTSNDPVFKVPKRFLKKRQDDEEKMRKLLTEDVPNSTGKPDFEEKMAFLRQEIFQLAYGKGVTAQMREDFLIRYGCTGYNDNILGRLLELCATRGMVEVGAGHGQWQKALTDAYTAARDKTGQRKQFDFVLAYDNHSNLPLNTHIYNQYTKPHHDYFGSVQRIESSGDLAKVLRSWACRGRALLMVYPPPGSMAIDTIRIYADASPENDMLIYVGEGRGGANGDDDFFDFLENGEWILIDILEVLRPPGDKGCEKLYILQKLRKNDP